MVQCVKYRSGKEITNLSASGFSNFREILSAFGIKVSFRNVKQILRVYDVKQTSSFSREIYHVLRKFSNWRRNGSKVTFPEKDLRNICI